MSGKYKEYSKLDLPKVGEEILKYWEDNNIFEESIKNREGSPTFIFNEGPPSANGMPGIHHVMSRTIKDLFCRYKTLKGFQVNRKAGWDTHGLPVELGVEKELGITKEDIGSKITIEEYNNACKESVMRYTDKWNEITRMVGYWCDLDDPYVTYKSKYMETVWYLLKQIYDKDLMYKGYTIQPYSPKAGTGLSSAELNMPGCYRDVKDTTVVAQFKLKEESHDQLNDLISSDRKAHGDLFIMAWTTTPWTLPSNTALCVGPKIDYVIVNSYNQYTFKPITVVVAKNLLNKHFNPANAELKLEDYKEGDKKIPFEVIGECKGTDLLGIKYHQLLPFCLPHEDVDKAFVVIQGDYVTTDDGTGIVHIAPTFGADDAMVAKKAGVPPLMVMDENENLVPLVDLQGRFVAQMGDQLGGMYVKNDYYDDGQAPDKSADVQIAIMLKEQNLAFKVEKYEHNYPHCWRTDKPVLYYPLDSWFIKATDVKERMQELNNTINWKPASTGTGRFGEWLKNVNDWNLSRSRYWGVPIPIWRTEDGSEEVCIGSVEQLKEECEKAVEAGVMEVNPIADFEVGNMDEANYEKVDLHKHIVDKIVLVSSKGEPMNREADLIDVWFDSGAVPYAQWHYPFENKEFVENRVGFPADFIAEGVDQTRGWFYTQHAIAAMCFDSVAFKNVISNGLVQDKEGKKMSKRLGNAIDPFDTINKYGSDATRWYMITNAQPWDNLKMDLEGITEVQRKFFGTLYNTYSFFALYANLDEFNFSEDLIPYNERPEIDRWIISKLNSLIKAVDQSYGDYEPTRAGRLIQDFVTEQLSNWYVRLCRRRFWKGDYSPDKIAAYQTLYTCLEVVAQLASPIAPFFADQLFKDLTNATGRHDGIKSIHLSDFPIANENEIDADLESRMEIAQKVSSLVLSLRKKEKIKVRQPLQKIMVPIIDESFKSRLEKVESLILSEVNVKELEYLMDSSGVLVKKIKPNFKALGPKYGKFMKAIAATVNQFSQEDIATIESNNSYMLAIEGNDIELTLEDVEISTQDIPGWLVITEGGITVALDITLTEELKGEGIARELVNKIQNLRKDSDFEVTDKISLKIASDDNIKAFIEANRGYICSETLAESLEFVSENDVNNPLKVEVDENIFTFISIERLNLSETV